MEPGRSSRCLVRLFSHILVALLGNTALIEVISELYLIGPSLFYSLGDFTTLIENKLLFSDPNFVLHSPLYTFKELRSRFEVNSFKTHRRWWNPPPPDAIELIIKHL